MKVSVFFGLAPMVTGRSGVTKMRDLVVRAVVLTSMDLSPAGIVTNPAEVERVADGDPTSPRLRGARDEVSVVMFILSVVILSVVRDLAVMAPLVLMSPFWAIVTLPSRMSRP